MIESNKPATKDSPDFPAERYAWYVVVILMLVYVLSFVDRQVLATLVGPIRTDLGISDTEFSLLAGLAFALFYTLFGIPIARLADSRSRRGLIAGGLLIWSAFTASCGRATTFLGLGLGRMGVGVGEATLSPSAYSMISDYFRPHRTALAISVYGAGIYLGTGIAYLVGGVLRGLLDAGDPVSLPIIGEFVPTWRHIFYFLGAMGIIFSPMLLTVREPVRRGIRQIKPNGQPAKVPLGEVVAYLARDWKTICYHNLGFAFAAFVAYGGAQWIPEFLIRTYDYVPSQAGIHYGLVVMIFGTAGIIFGGYLANRLTVAGYDAANMRVGMIAMIAYVPCGSLFPLMPGPGSALVMMAFGVFAIAMPFGVAPAAIQEMMPNQMRAQASALYLFVINLIGLGMGPTVVAIFTDFVYKGDDMLRYSLATVAAIFTVVGVVLLYLGTRHFPASLKSVATWQEGNCPTPYTTRQLRNLFTVAAIVLVLVVLAIFNVEAILS